jgi:hypothetical protein
MNDLAPPACNVASVSKLRRKNVALLSDLHISPPDFGECGDKLTAFV